VKIAYLLYAFPVITETFVLNQITGLIDKGHQVSIFCQRPYPDPIHHSDVDKYDLLSRTIYYGTGTDRLPANKFVRVVKAFNIFLAYLNKKPLPLIKALNIFKFGRQASSLGIFFLTVPFLENKFYDYDIAHCHFAPNGDVAAILKYIGAFNGKIATTLHGEIGYSGKKKWKNSYKNLFKRGDLFLPMSNKESQNLVNLGCDPQKIVVHRMGVDLTKFLFSDRIPAQNGKVRLLTVGRLVEKKGVEFAIRAVAKVIARFPDIEYNIGGDGPLKNHLQTLINQLNLGKKVKILGYQSQEKVIKIAKDSDIFLAPSVTSHDGDIEGIPVAIMEAMAQGLPVLSTQHAGIPELIEDGKSGFLVPERDPDALADKIVYLIQHRDLLPVMGAAGRNFIEKHHDIYKLNDKMVHMFHQLTT
jgi:colanic acid/amylovoran/stewartan biosynthesis glycosyltransferase WcaL/AmsK/CpsK